MRNFFLALVFFMVGFLSAQNTTPEIDFDTPDSLYREDQFYVGLSYNNMQNAPQGFDQVKISPNLVFGFLRDFPINKNRTWAIAPGLGYRLAVMNQNLGIPENGNSNSYIILSTDFDKNKLTAHYLELPIEIRWRTSTPETHRFWRIYTGFKLSYLIHDQYKFQGAGLRLKQTGNPDLEKLQYGAYISSGWNTWNAYIYYGFNPIFKNAALTSGEKIKLNAFNIGVMFYIL